MANVPSCEKEQLEVSVYDTKNSNNYLIPFNSNF
jgi:hypothetical protein